MHRISCSTSLLSMILCSSYAHAVPPNAPRSEAWIVNGSVSAVAEAGGVIYLGGSFDHVGPNTGSGVIVNSVSGAGVAVPRIVGNVNSAAGDGAGGWFVAGGITSVGGTPRSGIAHLLADGSLDAGWNAGTINGAINAMVVTGGRVYIGGGFTSVAGSARQFIAAVNASDGSLTAWDPVASAVVTAMAISGNTMYVGGNFTSIGGASRNKIAALNTNINTNNATAWNPDANGQVYALAVADNTVYAGGVFTQIGGQSRNHIAALDATINTNNATSWNPDNPPQTNAIYALAVSGNAVCAGGDFTNMDTSEKQYLAIINRDNDNSISGPQPDGIVRAIQVSGDTLYVGGDFKSINGQTRLRVAAIEGLPTAFAPHAGASVTALAVQGDAIFIGGTFQSIFGVPRSNIAAIDPTTGTPTSWNLATFGGSVSALLPAGSLIYAGGAFTFIGGASRNRIAALDATTGLATAWNPDANGAVQTLSRSGNTIYAGGSFTNIGGAARNRIAALDATINTNNATAWNPDATTGVVFSTVLSGTTLYAGGTFTTIGGASRNRIAALDTTINTNNATFWNPDASHPVLGMALSGTTLYAAGQFSFIGGAFRNGIAALDTTININNATAWNPSANNIVACLAVGTSPSIFAGGSFTSIGGQTRPKLAELDRTINTNNATAWSPAIVSSQINAISANALSIAVGGTFSGAGGIAPLNFALFGTNAPQWTPVSPGNWSSAASWTGGTVPNNSGPTHYNADIRGTNAVVTQDISPEVAIDTLNLVEGGTLNVTGGNLKITSAAGIQNQGNFTLGAGRSLIATVPMPLLGGFPPNPIFPSPLTMSATSTISSSPGSAVITNTASHTIAGQGTISANLLNQGTVRANVPAATLILNTGPKTNNGLFEATNGGILQINSPGVSGTGTFLADGGTIGVSPSPLSGGRLEARNSGVIQCGSSGALNISGLVTLTSGGIYQGLAGSGASLSAGGIAITVGSPGGQMHLGEDMDASAAGDVSLVGCNAGGGGGLLLGCTPPVLSMGGTNDVTIGGDLNLLGDVNIDLSGDSRVLLSGSFVNQSTDATIFDWEQGIIWFEGSQPQEFEIAGINLGPRNPAGFVNNFAMGVVYLTPDSAVTIVDAFDNSPGSGCEALYVHDLVIDSDVTLQVNCRIYYDTLNDDGASISIAPGAALMSTDAGDLDNNGSVGQSDLVQFVSVLLGGTCNQICMQRADLNGDGMINGVDIDFMVEVWMAT